MLNVDKSFCFSLKSATDRRELLTPEWKKLGIEVEYILSDKSKDPQKAISQGHQDICKLALENNWERILVFEDDCRCYDFEPKQIEQINDFLDKNDNWDLFYLGGILGRLWKTKYKGIARIRCAGVHSYIIPRRSYEKILAIDYDNTTKAVDTIYKKIFRSYAPFPLMTKQEDEEKLNSSLTTSRDDCSHKKIVPGSEEMWKVNRRKEKTQVYFKNLHKWLFRIDN